MGSRREQGGLSGPPPKWNRVNRIIQVLISLEYILFNVIPKSLVTLQFLIVQIKAYI